MASSEVPISCDSAKFRACNRVCRGFNGLIGNFAQARHTFTLHIHGRSSSSRYNEGTAKTRWSVDVKRGELKERLGGPPEGGGEGENRSASSARRSKARGERVGGREGRGDERGELEDTARKRE